MDGDHCHRAFADRRGAALDRAVPDVAGRENPGHVRLHRMWVAVERPIPGPVAVDLQVGAGPQVARLVTYDADPCRPISLRLAAEAKKQAGGFFCSPPA